MLLFLFAFGFFAVACGKTVTPKSFSLDRTSVQLGEGESVTLRVLYGNFGDLDESSVSVSWVSSAPAIASVSDGVVTGISEGSAVVTAAATIEGSDYKANCSVTVVAGAEDVYEVSFALDERNISMTEGEAKTLLPQISVSKNGEPTEAPEVVWSSSDDSVATVSGGRVTAVKAGETEIVASVSVNGKEYEARCAVTVAETPKAQVSIDRSTAELNAGTEITLEVTVSDASGTPVGDVKILWTSSDETVATVSDGVVRGLEGGYAVITAAVTAEGKEYSVTCDVAVADHYEVNAFSAKDSEHAAVYSLSDEKLTFAALLGQFEIDVERNGGKLTDYTSKTRLEAESSDGGVVTVSDGELSFLKTGECAVTLKFVDLAGGNEIARAELNVVICDKIISSVGEFLAIDDGSKYYALSGDLDFEGIDYALGASGQGITLTGTFNGNNYSLFNIILETGDKNNSGLFCALDGGTVKNLSLTVTFGELKGVDGWLYRFAPLALSGTNGATVENCFVQANYTSKAVYSNNHGITGLIGYPDGSVTVQNTIVAVIAPAEAAYAFGVTNNGGWNGWYTLRNVLIYASGENIAALGTNGALKEGSTYDTFVGGPDGTLAEPARESLLKTAEEKNISIFVQTQFAKAALHENGEISFGSASAEMTERDVLGLQYTAKNLIDGTAVAAEEIEWSSSDESVATVENGTVTALKAGEATVSAGITVGGKKYTASIRITVKELVTASVAFDEENPTQVRAEETITLSVTAKNLLENADIPSGEILWTSSQEGVATVENGVVTGVSVGESIITASVTVSGKTYLVSCSVTVLEKRADVYEISLSFGEEVCNLEKGGTYTVSDFGLSAVATKNGEEWDGWAEYVAYASSDGDLLAIEGSSVSVKGTGFVTVTATYNYAGATKTATTTVELWTEIIRTADEFLALGAYKDGVIADWNGRYLVAADLDFTGKTVAMLGNITGTLDGGGHRLSHISLAATGSGLSDNTTKEGDDRFLFYNVDGVVQNISITVTLGGESGVAKCSAGLCCNLNGIFRNSTLNVLFKSKSNTQDHKMTGGVCVYAGWESETSDCTINIAWMFTDWGTNGQLVGVNDRGFGYCYTSWGTKSAKLTNVKITGTAYILYANTNDNFVNTGSSVSQNADEFMSADDMKALFE